MKKGPVAFRCDGALFSRFVLHESGYGFREPERFF